MYQSMRRSQAGFAISYKALRRGWGGLASPQGLHVEAQLVGAPRERLKLHQRPLDWSLKPREDSILRGAGPAVV